MSEADAYDYMSIFEVDRITTLNQNDTKKTLTDRKTDRRVESFRKDNNKCGHFYFSKPFLSFFFFLYKSLTFILRLLSQFVSLFQLFVILFPHISFVFPFVGRVLYSVGVFSFHFLLRVPIILFSLYSFIFRDSIFDIKVRHG